MNEKKAEDFIPKVQEIVGDKFEVNKAFATGTLQVLKNNVVLFRIYQSMYRDGKPFILKVDVKDYKKIALKVAKELELEVRY